MGIRMEKERDYEEIFQKVMDYEQALHEKNLTRIKIGLKCIWIVPLIFLILLFFTGSNKVIFLILWKTRMPARCRCSPPGVLRRILP